MKVLEGIILFIVTCAVALLVWVNWTAIGDKVDNLIYPETQTEQVPATDDNSTDDDNGLQNNGSIVVDGDITIPGTITGGATITITTL